MSFTSGPPSRQQSGQPSSPPATASFPDLHSLAVDVADDLHALALGLQHAGVSPDAANTVLSMSQHINVVAQNLSHMPPQPNPAHAAAQQAEQQQQAQQQSAQGQPQGGPAQQGAKPAAHPAVAAAGNLAKAAASFATAHNVPQGQ